MANTNYELDRILGISVKFSTEDLLEFAGGRCPETASCTDCPVDACLNSSDWAIEQLRLEGIDYNERK